MLICTTTVAVDDCGPAWVSAEDDDIVVEWGPLNQGFYGIRRVVPGCALIAKFSSGEQLEDLALAIVGAYQAGEIAGREQGYREAVEAIEKLAEGRREISAQALKHFKRERCEDETATFCPNCARCLGPDAIACDRCGWMEGDE